MRIPLPFTDPWTYVRGIVEQTAELDNSMLYDLRSGVPTEVDFINGAVVAAGRRAGVPTPYNETLADLVRAREATRA
jgi:2-dehydropantoate 2-reductase